MPSIFINWLWLQMAFSSQKSILKTSDFCQPIIQKLILNTSDFCLRLSIKKHRKKTSIHHCDEARSFLFILVQKHSNDIPIYLFYDNLFLLWYRSTLPYNYRSDPSNCQEKIWGFQDNFTIKKTIAPGYPRTTVQLNMKEILKALESRT